MHIEKKSFAEGGHRRVHMAWMTDSEDACVVKFFKKHTSQEACFDECMVCVRLVGACLLL